MKHEKGGARKDNFLAVRLRSLVRIAFLLSSMERNPPRIVPYMDTHFLENGYAHRPRTSCQYIPVYTSHSHGSFVPELSYCDLMQVVGSK